MVLEHAPEPEIVNHPSHVAIRVYGGLVGSCIALLRLAGSFRSCGNGLETLVKIQRIHMSIWQLSTGYGSWSAPSNRNYQSSLIKSKHQLTEPVRARALGKLELWITRGFTLTTREGASTFVRFWKRHTGEAAAVRYLSKGQKNSVVETYMDAEYLRCNGGHKHLTEASARVRKPMDGVIGKGPFEQNECETCMYALVHFDEHG